MELTFRARHVPVTDSLREYTSKKLSRLGRYLPLVDEAVVELEQEGGENAHRYVVQLTVNCNGTYLRAEERGPRLLAAIDAAADVLSRQVRRFKERSYRSGRRGGTKEAARVEGLPPEEGEGEEAPPWRSAWAQASSVAPVDRARSRVSRVAARRAAAIISSTGLPPTPPRKLTRTGASGNSTA